MISVVCGKPLLLGHGMFVTRVLNLGVMRWEYEDMRDLGGTTAHDTGKG